VYSYTGEHSDAGANVGTNVSASVPLVRAQLVGKSLPDGKDMTNSGLES